MVDELVAHSEVLLRPDPTRVVIRPFTPADDDSEVAATGSTRAQRIADRVVALDPTDIIEELHDIVAKMSEHHRDVEKVLLRRFYEINGLSIAAGAFSPDQSLLIGAYFSEEYAFEAAAPSELAMSPCIEMIPGGAPDDPGVRLICEDSHDLSETIIFPVTAYQRHGIEDLRLIRFVDDDDHVTYLGTYTAFSGNSLREELLRTTDFKTFDLTSLGGSAASAKGMALFPRKIAGRYAMLGRQDHENIWLLTSDDLYRWEGGAKLVTPRWPWEFVQMGNSGSPIEIDEGWLVLTHGVGAARTYCIGACLLDKEDPSKVLARMTVPLIRPSAEERYGYVPNVVYSCGALVHGRMLLLPYAVADNFTKFATVELDALIAAMA
jgi:predicted GH43/DUF377 family glycosyl hydrolase